MDRNANPLSTQICVVKSVAGAFTADGKKDFDKLLKYKALSAPILYSYKALNIDRRNIPQSPP